MRRWVAGLGTIVVLAGVAGGWVLAGLRADLDRARRQARLVDLARAESDEDAQRLRRDLRRTQQRLDATERRLRAARSDLRDAYRPMDVVADVADERFCFTPYDGRFSGFVRGPLKADVDGDGSADRVYTVGRPTLLGDGCRYFVVADAGHTVYRARVTGHRLTHGYDAASAFQLYLGPRSAADLDGDGDAEILVGVAQGASVQAGAFFTVTDGELRRVHVENQPSDAVSYLGSLCCGGALDCVAGYVALSGYGRTGDQTGYVVTRDLYRLEGATLVHQTTERHRTEASIPRQFAEFRGRPLSGCARFTMMRPPFPSATGSPPVIRGPRG